MTDYEPAGNSAWGIASQLADSIEPLPACQASTDPLCWPGYPQALAAARENTGQAHAVLAGTARIQAHLCVLLAFEFAFLGGSMGEAEGRQIASAAETAVHHRLPLVSVVRSGGARMQEGLRALVQMRRVAAALAALRRAGLPHVAVALHPTTGGVWASLVADADYVVAEAGAQVCFAGSRVRGSAARGPGIFTAESQYAHGFADAVTDPGHLTPTVAAVLEALSPASRGDPAPVPLPQPFPAEPPSTGLAQVQCARRPGRPRAAQYLAAYFDRLVPIHGDRAGGADDTVECGFGRHGGRTIAYVAQQGHPASAAAFRLVRRLVETAGRLRIPVLTLIDSPGVSNDERAEAAGVGTALAQLLKAVADAPVPVLSVVIGEGGSGGAMALASDDLWLTADAYFSVIGPEAAASILKEPPERVGEIARRLRLGPQELVELGMARGVLA